MTTINKQSCPTCGQSINRREINLFSGMVLALFEVFTWCVRHRRHEFTRKEIKHLLKDDNQIARFGDWALFGGLVYKLRKGEYGLNMERCESFFTMQREIPTTIYKNPLTKELTPADYRNIKDIPKMAKFLDENREWITQYHDEEKVKQMELV